MSSNIKLSNNVGLLLWCNIVLKILNAIQKPCRSYVNGSQSCDKSVRGRGAHLHLLFALIAISIKIRSAKNDQGGRGFSLGIRPAALLRLSI